MHYFDWTATTRPTARVIEKVNMAMTEEWGNPSSVHGFGGSASKMVEEARRAVLRGLGFGREAPGRLIFTSGGTEANNLALLGAAYAKEKRGIILISEGEHASVEECAKALESDGFTVIRIPTRGGALDLDAIRGVKGEVSVASFMMVNNETGAVYDVAAAAKAVREKWPNAFIHTDAVQGFMKLRFTPERLGVNAVTVSAHKLGGLKGTGALYVDRESLKQKRLTPRILGGGQESGLRSGTENVAGIVAFGEAVRESMGDFAARTEAVAALRRELEAGLAGELVQNVPAVALPNILSVTVPGIKSETVLNHMNAHGFCISAGSACSSHGHGMSLALTGFGLDSAAADCTVRISLSHLNDSAEVAALCEALAQATTLGGLKHHK